MFFVVPMKNPGYLITSKMETTRENRISGHPDPQSFMGYLLLDFGGGTLHGHESACLKYPDCFSALERVLCIALVTLKAACSLLSAWHGVLARQLELLIVQLL